MLINFTNHKSQNWSAEQLAASQIYGNVFDMPFPEVDPSEDEAYISDLANLYAAQIAELNPTAVLCQGEMTLAFALVSKLCEYGVMTIAACSKRKVIETRGANGETVKCATFVFTRYRKYLV
jgi:hypothetical protein